VIVSVTVTEARRCCRKTTRNRRNAAPRSGGFPLGINPTERLAAGIFSQAASFIGLNFHNSAVTAIGLAGDSVLSTNEILCNDLPRSAQALYGGYSVKRGL